MPDHATPCALRTHKRYGTGGEYTESGVADRDPVVAHHLMARLLA